MTIAALKRELKAAGIPERAAGAARYFKTGAGEYGEGDVFLGVTVPALRKIALRYKSLSLDELQCLLVSKEHEVRVAALEKKILRIYLRNTRYINNWDLVDCSCRDIVGGHLKAGPRKLLDKLAKSKNIWERRIAMISTMPLIRGGDVETPLRVAETLLDDPHDLIHKAVGWVLRVVGDQDRAALLRFLKKHYERVPRTALRY